MDACHARDVSSPPSCLFALSHSVLDRYLYPVFRTVSLYAALMSSWGVGVFEGQYLVRSACVDKEWQTQPSCTPS